MDVFTTAERLMGMSETVWRRHANPWSVYSRFSCLPLLVLAVWSRVWIGWGCLVPIVLSLLWTWANPRLFAEPARLDTWASRAVMGERIYLNRGAVPVAAHHRRMVTILTGVSGVGMLVLIHGLYGLDLGATIGGMAVAMMGKVWFCDRMVWIWYDHQAQQGAGR
ncbi:MAG: DUF6653 family protein [Pseudomonadota bacterium]